MKRINLFTVILLVLALLPSAPKPVSAQTASVLSISNNIYDIFVLSSVASIGVYTVRTGPNHPVTLATGYPQSVLYGGAGANPGTSFTTVRSYTSATDYVTGSNHTSGFNVVNLDAYHSETKVVNGNEIQTVWNLPGPPATPDRLQILQEIKLAGTDYSNTSIEVRMGVTNLAATPVSIGVRYFWDVEIGSDDGPTFTQVNQNGSPATALLHEAQFDLPSFESYFVQDNDANPNPPTFGVHGTVIGPASFAPIAPSAIQFSSWPWSRVPAFDYTIDPNRDIASLNGDRDSAVAYLFGPSPLLELNTLIVSASIFATTSDADSDGDSLLNTWETTDTDLNGDGVIDVGPSVGSDPNKKDVYVEIDWMGSDWFRRSHYPKPEAIQKVVEAFADHDINLHVDVGPDSIDYVTNSPWGSNGQGNEFDHEDVIGDPNNLTKLQADWDRLRIANFGHSDRVYHHAIFVHEAEYLNDGGLDLLGQALPDSNGGPGQYIFVALGSKSLGIGTVNEQAGVFMHELGHSLGLTHGGDQGNDVGRKPNYLSVMNYNFTTSGLTINGHGGNMDYSEFDLPDLNEAALTESVGLNDARVNDYKTIYSCSSKKYKTTDANQPIDWDCDSSIDSQPTQADINGMNGNAEALTGWEDWSHLIFNGGNIGLAVAGNADPITVEQIANSPRELTNEQDLQIPRSVDPRVQLAVTVDSASVESGGIVTYTITMLNIDGEDANEVVIVDTLPAGFTYVPGSTSGATTNDPLIDGQNLSWSPFVVPANEGTLELTFQAAAPQVPGTYFNNVGGDSTNAFVVPTGDTAQVQVLPTPGMATVATGDNHTCSLSAAGGVYCWGINSSGQLGDGGTSMRRDIPAPVDGLSSGVVAIVTGSEHTCALTSTGGVKCWGANYSGQLGDGTATNRDAPVDVSGLTSGVVAISAGGDHTCALTTSGGVKCRGKNTNGQLGNGYTTQRTTPVNVTGLTSGVASISAGKAHTCAVTVSGGAKCWGDNSSGQLGDGTNTQRKTPVNVSGLTSNVALISAGGSAGGSHTCAVTTSGGAKCWGSNSHGNLGDGTTTPRTTPVDVTGLTSGVATISAGSAQTCALTTSGGAKCWGSNRSGEVGDGMYIDQKTPVDVLDLTSGVTAIATGRGSFAHTCAMTASGYVKCWGYNGWGELGIGETDSYSVPMNTSGLDNAMAVETGSAHTCALTSAGGVKCWGENGFGQLGNGATSQSNLPVDVTSLTSGVTAISAGGQSITAHTCALTSDGGVKCWGANSDGQLGDGTTTTRRTTPVDVSGLTSGAVQVAAGSSHTCALTAEGGVKCWGDNSSGQLGDGTTTRQTTPVDVSGLTSGVIAISAGQDHTCALTMDGGVKCWGANNSGELGDGTNTQQLTPVDVNGLTSGVTAISAGATHTCALTTEGGVKCWGDNSWGRLGDGTMTDRNTPVDVSGLVSEIAAISAGGTQTCALTVTGGVMCWGENISGELGDGTTDHHTTPVDVSGLASGVATISAGGYPWSHTCALMSGGSVQCWGDNSYGQVGNGLSSRIPIPMSTLFNP